MRALHALLALFVILAGLTLVPGHVPAPVGPAKAKVFYLHNATQDLGAGPVLLMNTTLGTPAVEAEDTFTDPGWTMSWFLSPRLAADILLSGSVTLHAWMLLNSGGGIGTTRVDLAITVYDIGPAGTRVGGPVAAGTAPQVQITTHYSEYFVSASLGAPRTIPRGNSLEIEFTLGSSNSATKQVAWGSERFRSRVDLTTEDYVNIEAAGAQTAAGVTPLFFTDDEDIHLVANVSDPFGGYDVRWVNVTVVAPDGTVVLNRAPMAQTAGGPVTFYTEWERVYSALNKRRGTYQVTVEAVDNTGYYYRFPDRPGDLTYGGHLRTSSFTFVVEQDLYVNVRVLDDANVTVAGALVELWDVGVRLAWNTTGGAGTTNLTAVPGTGTYSARVIWQDTLVYDQSLLVSGNVSAGSPIDLRVAIYYVTLRLVDVGLAPVPGAAVFVAYPNGSATLVPLNTDALGEIDLGRVPGGAYGLRARWRGAQVFQGTPAIAASGVEVLQASVYYLMIQARDSRGLPVENVDARISDPTRGLIVDSVATALSGDAVSRLPAGTYALEAWWSGALVASRTNLTLTANRTEPLTLPVYYATVRVLDSRNASVLGAFVALQTATYTASGITDDQGEAAGLRVPAGDFTLTVTWDGVEVYRNATTVTGMAVLQVQARIHYLTVRTEESGGRSLPEVFVTVRRGNDTVAAAATDVSGEAEFRLPAGDYTIEARLVTTFLLTAVDQTERASVTLDQDREVPVVFDNYPVPVFVTTLFWILALIFLVLVALFFYVRRRRQAPEEAAAGEAAEEIPPPDEEKPEATEPTPEGTPEETSAPMEGATPSAEVGPAGEAAPVAEATEGTLGVTPAAATGPREHIRRTDLVGKVSADVVKCAVCLGSVKAGTSILECATCGTQFHLTCATRALQCPGCGLAFSGVVQ